MTMESPVFDHNDTPQQSSVLYEDVQAAMPSPEHRESTTPPFVLALTEAESKTFRNLMDEMALTHMIGIPGFMAQFKEARGEVFSEDKKRLLSRLEATGNEQRRHGMDLETLDNLQFRWVAASPETRVDRLIQEAYAYGGNAPEDQSSWVHVGDSVVEDIMRQPNRQTSGVLFVYDGDKLTPLTQEDMDADRANSTGKGTYMHAQKPLPGLELKDALIGMISFDSPQNVDQQF